MGIKLRLKGPLILLTIRAMVVALRPELHVGATGARSFDRNITEPFRYPDEWFLHANRWLCDKLKRFRPEIYFCSRTYDRLRFNSAASSVSGVTTWIAFPDSLPSQAFNCSGVVVTSLPIFVTGIPSP